MCLWEVYSLFKYLVFINSDSMNENDKLYKVKNERRGEKRVQYFGTLKTFR